MNTIRILGLDDDYHSPIWIVETGIAYPNAESLMRHLSAPHSHQYEIKLFAISDEWSEELCEFYEEEAVFKRFDNLFEEFDLESFNLFWHSANRSCW